MKSFTLVAIAAAILFLSVLSSAALSAGNNNNKKKPGPCSKENVYSCDAPCGNGTTGLGCCSYDYECCPLSACGLTPAPEPAHPDCSDMACYMYENKTDCDASGYDKYHMQQCCGWCNNKCMSLQDSPKDGNRSYECCIPPPDVSESCQDGPTKACGADSTCHKTNISTHYGPCFQAACCPKDLPVACNGQCYAAGTICCQDNTCDGSAGETCCTSGFQASACCKSGQKCCGYSWEMYCCDADTHCGDAYNMTSRCAKKMKP